MAEFLNVRQVAKLVKADPRTIQRNAKKGKYPKDVCGRHGRYWLFNQDNADFFFICNSN